MLVSQGSLLFVLGLLPFFLILPYRYALRKFIKITWVDVALLVPTGLVLLFFVYATIFAPKGSCAAGSGLCFSLGWIVGFVLIPLSSLAFLIFLIRAGWLSYKTIRLNAAYLLPKDKAAINNGDIKK